MKKDFPASAQEANDHINQIRASLDHEISSNMAESLDNALSLVSDQLYHKSSQFLFEIIQNTDDNTYDERCQPTLHIEYTKGILHLSCNEVGFSKQDLESLCKIGRSTKSGSADHTGEKGIGFKSVFRVADVVWVTSGYYNFKFDKSQRLGTISPWPAEFPISEGLRAQREHTVFRLQLSRDCNEADLIRDIKALDPRLLLFLRRLRRLEISLAEPSGLKWSTTIARGGEDGDPTQPSSLELLGGCERTRYLITHFPMREFEPSARDARPREPKISLGFPVTEEGCPVIAPQLAHAYLPIRDYGFKFLIQADFRLVASRQDIDDSASWNHRILQQLPNAILDAISKLSDGPMRYTWPRYFEKRSPMNDFFAGLESRIASLLSSRPAVLSCAGSWTLPKNVRRVGDTFLDRHGNPLLLCDSLSDKYLSTEYVPDSWAFFERLGLGEQGPEEFVRDLEVFVKHHNDEFRQKSSDWHSSLSTALITIIRPSLALPGPGSPTTAGRLRDLISKLELIPLRNGDWRAAVSSGRLCFPSPRNAIPVPMGIDLWEVSLEVEQDEERNALCQILGVQAYSPNLACESIFTMHRGAKCVLDPCELSAATLASHALFIYLTGANVLEGQKLWFVAKDGTYGRGSDLYVESQRKFAASSWPLEFVNTIRFLHGDYLSIAHSSLGNTSDGIEKWINWLESSHGVRVYPELLSKLENHCLSSLVVSDDFYALVRVSPSSLVLEFLEYRWHHCLRAIAVAGGLARGSSAKSHDAARDRFYAALGSIQVSCLGGQVTVLKQTTLPTKHLPDELSDHLYLLDVPDPADPRWYFLRLLGVSMTLRADTLVHQLRGLSDAGSVDAGSVDARVVAGLYDELQVHRYSDEDKAFLRQAFSEESLILVPGRNKQADWVKSKRCVWGGNRYLRRLFSLKSYYPHLGLLFQGILQIQDADIHSLATEASFIAPADSLETIADLFIAISHALEDAQPDFDDTQVRQLASKPIFPVKDTCNWGAFDSLQTALDDDLWLIVDTPRLNRIFDRRVKLLAFDQSQIKEMSHLLTWLDLDRRQLSRVARQAVNLLECGGSLASDYSTALRRKAHLIASLVQEDDSITPDTAYKALRVVSVYEVDEIVDLWLVKLPNGSTEECRTGGGCASVRYGDDRSEVTIYITRAEISNHQPPNDLIIELAKYGNIQGANEVLCLRLALMETDITLLTREFEDQGISVLTFASQTLTTRRATNLTNDRASLVVGEATRGGEGASRTPESPQEDLMSFIQEIDRTKSVGQLLSRAWTTDQALPLLSEACRLSGRDVTQLLPWAGVAKINRPRPSEAEARVIIRTSNTGSAEWKDSCPATDVRLQALYYPRSPAFVIYSKNIDHVTEEVAFLGELAFSNFLESHLGNVYCPMKSWTSVLRARAGYPPYERAETSTSTFTIQNSLGSFSTLLSRLTRAPSITLPCSTFHVEVVTTEGDLKEADFFLSAEQFQKAQKLSIGSGEMLVLARVYNIYTNPRIAIFVDPWKMVADASLLVLNEAHYNLAFAGQVPRHISLAAGTGEIKTPPRLGKVSRVIDRLTSFKRPHAEQHGLGDTRDLYEYKPLSGFRNIRILTLYPGAVKDPLRGALREADLEAAGEFTALSYQWGPPLKVYPFHTDQGQILITASLNSAFRRVRDPRRTMVFWVDAVCINQDDAHEKAVQIRLMGEIFKSADSVSAWVGEEGEDGGRALEALLQIRYLVLNPRTWPSGLRKPPESWRDTGCCPGAGDAVWASIEGFFERGWFSRAWIIQEVVFAAKISVYCGPWTVDWDGLFAAFKTCVRKRPRLLEDRIPLPGRCSPMAAYTLGTIREIYRDRLSKRFSLLQLLDLFAYTEATNRIDKMFTLLTLATDADERAFYPDYMSPLEDVAYRYAARFVERGDVLQLLCRAGVSKSFPFSSWIPCWTSTRHPQTISTWHSVQGPYAASGSGSSTAVHSHVDGIVLVVDGAARVDRIARLGTVTRSESDVIEYVNALHREVDAALRRYPTGESLESVKQRLPTGDASRAHLDPLTDVVRSQRALTTAPLEPQASHDDASSVYTECYASNFDVDSVYTECYASNFDVVAGMAHTRCISDFLGSMRRDDVREDLFDYWQTASAFSTRLSVARFCATERGYAGLVPRAAQVGDAIVLLQGAPVPFVVRDNGNGTNKLIGECYIHGIMHGEGLTLDGVEEKCCIRLV